MIEKRVVEKLHTFLWQARCAFHGQQLPDSGNTWTFVYTNPDGRDWETSRKVCLADESDHELGIVEHALRAAGFDVTVRRRVRLEPIPKRAIWVKLNGRDVEGILHKFDQAIDALPAARVDFLLGRMAGRCGRLVDREFGKDPPPGAHRYRPPFLIGRNAYLLDEPLRDSLVEAVRAALTRQFQLTPDHNEPAVMEPDRRVKAIAKNFAKDVAMERMRENRNSPGYRLPAFDHLMVKQLTEKVKMELRDRKPSLNAEAYYRNELDRLDSDDDLER